MLSNEDDDKLISAKDLATKYIEGDGTDTVFSPGKTIIFLAVVGIG
jgi:hypothetical protein